MYCTVAEVREVATSLTTTMQPTPATDPVLTKIIERASRMFDRECGAPDEYFEPASGSTSARTFYGDGTNYLRLDPYVEGTLDTAITLPDGYTVPSFVERNGYLVISSNGVLPPFSRQVDSVWAGWYSGVAVTVTAQWGYAATPADVKHAIIELVINLFRETDPAHLKLTSLESGPLRERLPPRVASIARKYRLTSGVAFV